MSDRDRGDRSRERERCRERLRAEGRRRLQVDLSVVLVKRLRIEAIATDQPPRDIIERILLSHFAIGPAIPRLTDQRDDVVDGDAAPPRRPARPAATIDRPLLTSATGRRR